MSKFHITHINLSHGFRGGERQTVLLIKGLSKFNLKQCLICRKTSPLIQHLEDIPNLQIVDVSDKPDARLLGHIKIGTNTELIQAHETLAAQSSLLHHTLFKTPYVITRRVDDKIRNNAFNKAMYSKAAACVGVSSVISKVITDTFNVRAITIHSAFSGIKVNTEEQNKINKQWQGRFVIGQVGALVDRHKGQSTLLGAIKILQKKIPNLLVVFLGDGADKEALIMKSQGLPVDFLGFHNNVADYISNFDVFAFPSNNEGLGSVILDAMYLKVPVVASNVGGIPDLVTDNVSGLLITKGNSEQLADRILKIYSNKELTKQLTNNAYQVAINNSTDIMTQHYLSLYRQICRNLF